MQVLNQSTLFNYMKNVLDFKNELQDISKKWDQLILLSELSSSKIGLSDTKENFNILTSELINHLSDATLEKVINEMYSKAQVTVDIVIRNLFERTADIGFLATDNDIRQYLINIPKYKHDLENYSKNDDDTLFRTCKNNLRKDKALLHKRFEEYVAKYSVYYDIVLFDKKGNIVNRLDSNITTEVNKSNDDVLKIAEVTKEEFVETYKYHDFLPNKEKSLVYTYKVTKDNSSDEILGYLSLCFKFQDEMKGIFLDLVTKENKEVLTLLDSNYTVIATSDKYHIPLEATLEVELENKYRISQFAGRDYIIKTCKTSGYEGFYGLGWLGHIMIPLESAFNIYTKEINLTQNILQSLMQNESLFKKELLQIPKKAELIQNELDRGVWNGSLQQFTSDLSNTNFARLILKEVKSTGENTKGTFNNSIEKLNQTIVSSLLDNVSFLASLSMDIMDRNLYERANDCRWWALTSIFKETLENNSEYDSNNLEEVTKLLKYINSLYTVYTNLFIYDNTGKVLAVSNEKYNNIINTKLNEKWITNTLKIKDSSKYYVSYFDKTFLYDGKYTFIFNAAINNDENENIGGIGIVFDCENQFKAMLQDALPSNEKGEVQTGYFSLFVEKNYGTVISCSDDSHQIGEKIDIDSEFLNLKRDESLSKIIEYRGKYYLVGAKCSKGYREFKGKNDNYQKEIFAYVFIEAGNILEEQKKHISENENNYIYPIVETDELVEIATFYIDNKWLGVKAGKIIEAINITTLEKPINMDSNHHFKGTIIHKNHVVSVLDISPFIDQSIKDGKNEIIIMNYDDDSSNRHTIGIVSDKLGDILKVPKSKIKPFEKHLIGGGILGESIVQPPVGNINVELLTLLDISKISSLDEYNPINTLT